MAHRKDRFGVNTPPLRLDNCVAVEGAWVTWKNLAARCAVDTTAQRTAVVAKPSELLATLAAAARDGGDVLLATPDRMTDGLREVVANAGFSFDGSPGSPAVRHRITVPTSGTTGTPKLIDHSLASLATMASTTPPQRTWLLPFAPGTYAWYQLAVLGLTVEGQSLVPVAPTSEPADWQATALASGVDSVSATPTFWRRAYLALGNELAQLPLRQITLGGEVVDQPTLDLLAGLFPDAQISHIYASTEAGACMAVHDKQAGFPRSWLDEERRNGVTLRVDDGRLHVRSPFGTRPGEWIDTGDAVKTTENRVVVTGRIDSSFINVGGTKVDANEVRRTLLEHPDVRWANVRSRQAPVVGEMPVAEVVLDLRSNASSHDLAQWSRERLPEAAVPRIIRVLDEIPMANTGKTEVGK